MTPDQFCYWLQGLLELMPDLKALDEKQLAMVRTHLGYVFEHGHLDSGARKRDMLEELHKRGVPVSIPVPATPASPVPQWPVIDPLRWGPGSTGDQFDFPPRVIC